MAALEMAAALVVMIWLGICVYMDLKTLEVPNPLTLIPLFCACVVQVVFGDVELFILVLVLVLVSDLPLQLSTGIGLSAFIALSLLCPEQLFLLGALFLVWTFWRFNITGGADVKILMTLLLIFQNPDLLTSIWIAGGVQGLVAMFFKEKTIPFTISIAAGTGWFLLSTYS